MNLTPRQNQILNALYHGGVLNVRRLGDAVQLKSPSSVQHQVKQLAEAGLIWHVHIEGWNLTEAGKEALRDAP